MNFLGIGPAELVVIAVVLLVVAGPKRMIEWAYHAGRYAAQLRAMFQETMDAFQKELAASGVEVPKELTDSLASGRFDIVSEAAKVINADLNNAGLNDIAANLTTTTAATASSTTTENPVSNPSSDTKTPSSDGETPTRYDSWLPN